jgi:hypothetical protein
MDAAMSVTHLHTRHPKARKRHICWECLCRIEPGTTYQVDHLVCDGSAYTIKAHQDCAAASAELAREWGTQEDGHGPLHEEITSSGEPLENFALPDAVRARLAHAFARRG